MGGVVFPRRPWPPWTCPASGQLLADELAHDRAVGAAGHLRHDVRHHPAEVAHARRADLGDRAVDDLLQLLLVELLRHELGEHAQLPLLGLRLLGPAPGPKRLRRLDPPLALPLGAAETREEKAQRVAPLVVAGPHGILQLTLESLDQAHAGITETRP